MGLQIVFITIQLKLETYSNILQIFDEILQVFRHFIVSEMWNENKHTFTHV